MKMKKGIGMLGLIASALHLTAGTRSIDEHEIVIRETHGNGVIESYRQNQRVKSSKVRNQRQRRKLIRQVPQLLRSKKYR
jgi:hypothetical protein